MDQQVDAESRPAHHRSVLRRVSVVALAGLVGGGGVFAAQKYADRGTPAPTAGAQLHCASTPAAPASQTAADDKKVAGPANFIPSYLSYFGTKLPDDYRVTFRMYLNLRDAAGAEALARAVSDPSSPVYGQYITADQFHECFSAGPAQVAPVNNFLVNKSNFTPAGGTANNEYVQVSGTVAQINAAFGVQIMGFLSGGQPIYAPVGQPLIPASLKPLVAMIGGLDGRLTRSLDNAHELVMPSPTATDDASVQVRRVLNSTTGVHTDHVFGEPQTAAATAQAAVTANPAAPPSPVFVQSGPCSTYYGEKLANDAPPGPDGVIAPWVVCGYTPQQLQSAYGVDKLLKRGIDGRGVRVAIMDAFDSPTIASDANTYANKHGQKPFAPGQFVDLGNSTIRNTPAGGACDTQGWYGEQTLDVEAVHAMAPGATVVYQPALSCMDNDMVDALNNIVDNQLADIVSNSWGMSGEQDPSNAVPYQNIFIQAATQGITIGFSSGDNGDGRMTGTLGADFPASSPWVTAIGGTSLGVDKNGKRSFEVAWGTVKATEFADAKSWVGAAQQYGAGGGTSAMYAQPDYQKGVVNSELSLGLDPVTRQARSMRSVPDVALVGDPNTGFIIGQTQTMRDGSAEYSELRIGGTSLAMPLWAGIQALADQSAGHHHGFANYALYNMARHSSAGLHDVVPSMDQRAEVRADFNNHIDKLNGITVTIRYLDFNWTLMTQKGYDQVTGLGTPNAPAYVKGLG